MEQWFSSSEVQSSTFIVLCLSAIGCVSVPYMNARAWRKLQEKEERRRPQIFRGRILVLTTLLAIMTIASAIVAYTAPKSLVLAQLKPDGELAAVQVTDLWAAIFFVVVLGVVLSVDAYIIWLTYLGCSAIVGTSVVPWKTWLMRFYLVAITLTWWLRHIPYQVQSRRSPISLAAFYLQLSYYMIAFVGHVAFFAIFSVSSVVNLIRSETPAVQAADREAKAELRSLAMRSLVYIWFSLLLYMLVWVASIVRPLDLQLDVTITPYSLANLLLAHGCFVASVQYAPAPDTEEAEISPKEDVAEEVMLTADEAAQRQRRLQGARAKAAAVSQGSSSLLSGRQKPQEAGASVDRQSRAHQSSTFTSGSRLSSVSWEEGYLTQSYPPSLAASDKTSKEEGVNISRGLGAGSDCKKAGDDSGKGGSNGGGRKSDRSWNSTGRKSGWSGSSSLSSKAGSSGEAATAIAIDTSPQRAPAQTGSSAGQGGGSAANYSHWLDLFRQQS